jgi:hypothetical protein
MIVLSFGMLKSGSTLAFELCKSILSHRHFEQRRLPDGVVAGGHTINFLEQVTVAALLRVLEEVAPSEIIALKTHSAIHPAEMQLVETAISEGRMRVHVNLRDPREMALSLVDAGARAREKRRQAFSEIVKLEDAVKVVERQLAVCRSWGCIRGATYLHYNDVAFDTPAAVRRMCEDLGLEMFDDDELQPVIDRVFNEVFTQRNKAVKDRYKDDLTVRQNEFLLDEIRGARAFIRRVCEQRDYGWFTQPRERDPEAAKAHPAPV